MSVPGTDRRSTLAGRLVGVAVLVLPAGPVRERYRQELAAELVDISAPRRLGYAVRVLVMVFALRRVTADGAPATGLAALVRPARAKPLLCRLNLHKWKGFSADDGQRYLQCVRCRKDDAGTFHGPMDGAWPIGLHPGGRP